MDRFEKAIVVAAVTTCALSIALVVVATEGSWYLRVGAAVLVWAICWLAMGITSGYADDD